MSIFNKFTLYILICFLFESNTTFGSLAVVYWSLTFIYITMTVFNFKAVFLKMSFLRPRNQILKPFFYLSSWKLAYWCILMRSIKIQSPFFQISSPKLTYGPKTVDFLHFPAKITHVIFARLFGGQMKKKSKKGLCILIDNAFIM